MAELVVEGPSMKIGYFLSSEEYTPADLVAQAQRAEEAGFQGLWISDHYHPWTDAQGQSPLVWSVIGAIAQVTERVPVATAVTCPTVRIHPAIIAQAAATSQVMLNGRFTLGVGSGEALNEHIVGEHWPEIEVRLEMLDEAVDVIRQLWSGRQVSHHGVYYEVENARVYTMPDTPPPIYVSGLGRRSTDLAARIGDGFITTAPTELIRRFRDHGGGDKPVQASLKVRYSADRDEAMRTVHRLWPNYVLPGELSQVLPTPAHFEQATQLVTPEMVARRAPCGPNLDEHVQRIQQYVDAGADELYIHQIGGNYDELFAAYQKEILPRFAS